MLGHLVVDAGRDAVEELDHRHVRAEPAPHRTELEADDAGADHDQMLGHLGELQRAGRRHDLLLVDRHTGQAASLPSPRRSGCSWSASVSLTAPSSPSTDTAPALSMRPVPWNEVILFLRNRKATPLVVASTTSPLRFMSWAKSSLGGAEHDAVRGEIVAGFLEQVRGLQQRLGRDAADIEAGAAEGRALLDHGHLHAELGGADRRHIAARSGADHDEIEGFVCHDATPPLQPCHPSAARVRCSCHDPRCAVGTT